MKKTAWLIMACLALLSCRDSGGTTELAQDYFREAGITFDKDETHCLIIPGGGCPGCIATGIHFLRANKDFFSREQQENRVVFTSTQSIKLLRRRLKDVSIESLNALVDTANAYTIRGSKGKYPLVLYLEEGTIVRAELQSPDADALAKLWDSLHKQKR